MKKLSLLKGSLILAILPCLLVAAESIGFVNFKTIVDESKLGKQEQAAFEGLKDQMEKILEEKEKELNQLAEKLNDPDTLDTLSVEAETELKRKFRLLGQEFTEKQNQFYQALQQAHAKITAKLGEYVAKASQKLADVRNLDVVFNSDATFFISPKLDVSKGVVEQLDQMYMEEATKANETKKTISP